VTRHAGDEQQLCHAQAQHVAQARIGRQAALAERGEHEVEQAATARDDVRQIEGEGAVARRQADVDEAI
jgi:hypothetical protein